MTTSTPSVCSLPVFYMTEYLDICKHTSNMGLSVVVPRSLCNIRHAAWTAFHKLQCDTSTWTLQTPLVWYTLRLFFYETYITWVIKEFVQHFGKFTYLFTGQDRNKWMVPSVYEATICCTIKAGGQEVACSPPEGKKKKKQHLESSIHTCIVSTRLTDIMVNTSRHYAELRSSTSLALGANTSSK